MRTRETLLSAQVAVVFTLIPFFARAQSPQVPSQDLQTLRGEQTAPVSGANAARNAAGLDIIAARAGAAVPSAAAAKQSVILTSPGVAAQGFRRVPQGGGVGAPETLFPVGNGAVTARPIPGSINQAPSSGGGGAAGAATTAGPPAPTTTFPGYLVGSPYPFVLPPPDIPYFGSKWNGPWGYPIGHYQAFRGTGQYITHYQYYPLSYFGSLMAPFAYGVSGKK